MLLPAHCQLLILCDPESACLLLRSMVSFTSFRCNYEVKCRGVVAAAAKFGDGC
jgi:hypothetical protein